MRCQTTMSRKKTPEMINVPVSDLEAMKLRILEGTPLTESDKTIVLSIVTVYQWMYQQLQATKLTIRRLKKLFSFSTEKKPKTSNPPNNLTKPNESSPLLPPELPEAGQNLKGKEEDAPQKKF